MQAVGLLHAGHPRSNARSGCCAVICALVLSRSQARCRLVPACVYSLSPPRSAYVIRISLSPTVFIAPPVFISHIPIPHEPLRPTRVPSFGLLHTCIANLQQYTASRDVRYFLSIFFYSRI
ncbi:hypothetical protein VTO73DRAFT_9264 [Trametes versicolor]